MKYKKNILSQPVRNVISIALGVCFASIGLKCFLLPNNFLDGGAMGVALLLERLTHINLSFLIILVNLPFILLGRKQISNIFAVKSAVAILTLAILVHIINIPVLTNDKLLISVFGGFFLGAGIGFAIRGGAVIDGTEVLAVTTSRKTSLTVGDVITIFNFLLFSIAALLINQETAMYSMLTYLAASKTVDFIINGIEEYIGVTIISDNALGIKQRITEHLGMGVTVYNAISGFGKSGVKQESRKILYCVITRLEVSKLLAEVEKIDDDAFIVQHTIKDTRGGMIKRRPLH